MRIYDLSQPFGYMTPTWPLPGERQDPGLRRVQYHEKNRKRSTIYTGSLHMGTHMDAPIHVIDGAPTLDKVPLERCYGTGVIVDLRHLVDKKWYLISSKDLEDCRPRIEPDDFVVINTGWHRLWKVRNYDYFNYSAGLVPDAAEWLVKRGIKAIAVDHSGLDTSLAQSPLSEKMPWLHKEYLKETGKDADIEFPEYEPCHRIFLSNGIPGIESAGGDLDLVTGRRCTIAAFPFRLEEGDGGMVRLVAIVDE